MTPAVPLPDRVSTVTTLQEALQHGSARLAESGSSTPRLDAQLLLGHVAGRSRTQLLTWPESTLDAASVRRYDDLIDQRLTGVPVAYLTGTRDFLEYTLQVGPGVLVPRPETELLVEWGRQFLRETGELSGRVIVDVGTGSGAIAIGLCLDRASEGATIIGADPSHEALGWAGRNREGHALGSRLHLVRGYLLTWFGGQALLVLANLPYLRTDQVEGAWELSAEPGMALEAGADGLALIERLVTDLPRVLSPDGAIGLEIDPSQAAAVDAMLAHHLPHLVREVHADLAGLARFVTASPH